MDIDIIPYDSEHVFEEEAQYQEVMMRYYCAILEMRTKLEAENPVLYCQQAPEAWAFGDGGEHAQVPVGYRRHPGAVRVHR